MDKEDFKTLIALVVEIISLAIMAYGGAHDNQGLVTVGLMLGVADVFIYFFSAEP